LTHLSCFMVKSVHTGVCSLRRSCGGEPLKSHIRSNTGGNAWTATNRHGTRYILPGAPSAASPPANQLSETINRISRPADRGTRPNRHPIAVESQRQTKIQRESPLDSGNGKQRKSSRTSDRCSENDPEGVFAPWLILTRTLPERRSPGQTETCPPRELGLTHHHPNRPSLPGRTIGCKTRCLRGWPVGLVFSGDPASPGNEPSHDRNRPHVQPGRVALIRAKGSGQGSMNFLPIGGWYADPWGEIRSERVHKPQGVQLNDARHLGQGAREVAMHAARRSRSAQSVQGVGFRPFVYTRPAAITSAVW